jgi:diguanylate cyclase (GGDEF)-like protein
MTTLRRNGRRRLKSEVSSAFRIMSVGMLVIVLITSSTALWVRYVYAPEVDELRRASTEIERTHVAMVDVETSLRAYFLVKEDRFLTPYVRAQETLKSSLAALDEVEFESTRLTRDAVYFRVAQQRWAGEWASEALAIAFGDYTAEEVAAFVEEGRVLFDEYRDAHAVFADGVTDELERRTGDQSLALTVLLGALVGVALVVAGLTVSRRRRLVRKVVQPVSQLRATVDAVATGDLSAPPEFDASEELVALRDGLARMTEALAEERQAAIDRQVRTDEMASWLQEVVTFARDLSGSLSLHHVLSAVGDAVKTTAGARRVRIWLAEAGEEEVFLAHDTEAGPEEQLSSEVRMMNVGLFGRAVQRGEPQIDKHEGGGSRSAWPMVVGARVTGIVEFDDPSRPPSQDLLQHIQSLIRQGAATIEAARLHQQTERLSTQDGLTGLANRRRFDEDLARETELALRHARRLGFVMLDLDHFKQVNDTYGHQRGDQVLQEVGAVLRHEARSSDYVYRYGGEEFAILVAEADADATVLVAERMRHAIEEHFRSAGHARQTVSCGVASLPEHAATAAGLVAAADGALYVAKQLGRNRVAVADLGITATERRPFV